MFIDNDPGSGSMIQDPAAWSRFLGIASVAD